MLEYSTYRNAELGAHAKRIYRTLTLLLLLDII